MPPKYTAKATINRLDNGFVQKGSDKIYKEYCINNGGNTIDTNERYTEIIADQLNKRYLSVLGGISAKTRFNSYCIPTHKGLAKDSIMTNRVEENIAKAMFENKGSYGCIGTIIDYQIPLNNKQGDGLGKIDLLSYDAHKGILWLLELKKPDNTTETLLRCILEVYTYWKTVDSDALISDFRKKIGANWNKTEVKKAVLIFNDSIQNDAYMDTNQPSVKQLLKNLDVCVFTIDGNHRKKNTFVKGMTLKKLRAEVKKFQIY